MRLYNTLTRGIEEFKPINPDNIGMYTCGPTVYREVHIGNFRTYLTSDILRRVLMANGYKVTSVMNITDVGHMRIMSGGHHPVDPVIQEALSQGKTPQEITREYSDKFYKDSKKLNILPHDFYPRATEHIKEMTDLIKALIERGFAYETNGTVYFNVKKFRNYGKLSGNTLDKMDQLLHAVRVSVETDKKDSADFALWKRAEPGRIMQWDSPWGEGFPGWHIECSAMSMKYLNGERSRTIDIHVGGEDLIFPHHEDEIAQSEASTGEKFVNYWIHSNYLLVDNQKMSRSKRNVFTIGDLEKKNFSPLAFRYLTFQTHYRTRMNFTWKALTSAQSALDRLYDTASTFPEPRIGCAEFEQEFSEAVLNDLDMPRALSIMWELLRSSYPDHAKAESLYKMDEVLGLSIRENREALLNIPKDIVLLIEKREELRKRRRFGESDKIRIKIQKMGYIVRDTGKGARVIRKVYP